MTISKIFKIKYCLAVLLFVIIVNSVHILTAVLYKDDFWESLLSAVGVFGILNMLLVLRIYRPIDRFLQSGQDSGDIRRSVNQLNLKTIAAFILSSCIYITIRLYLIFAAQPIEWEFKKILLLVYASRYVLFAAFITYLTVSAFTVGLKKHLADNFAVSFSPGRNKLQLWLFGTFGVLFTFPLVDLYYALYFSEKMDKFIAFITNPDLGLINTLIILLISTYIAMISFAGTIYPSLKEIMIGFGKLRTGQYGCQTAILTSNELGRLAEDFNQMSRGLEEKEFIKDTFGKYIAPEIAAEVMKRNIDLSGEFTVATIVFTDIADFTTISEKMEPHELVVMLNAYFTFLVAIIQKHKGVVNKFMGDAIMAVFNAPVRDADHADHALQAALEIIKTGAMMQFNGVALQTRIGINTDKILIGNIGAESRLEYTVIGDGVNMASRLEQLNKSYDSQIMIGQGTRDLLKREYQLEMISGVNIKGKKRAANRL